MTAQGRDTTIPGRGEPGSSTGGVLIVDVDGVLSPEPGPEKRVGGFTDWKRPPTRPRTNAGGRHHARLSPQMGQRLAATGATIMWLTSWGELANVHLRGRLGWPSCDVIDWPRRYHTDGMLDHRWKVEGLARWLDANGAPDGRVVWADDELRPGGQIDLAQLGNPLVDAGIDHLLVGPDPVVGLTTDQVEQIVTFLTGR